LSNLILKSLIEGASTTSEGKLFHFLIILLQKISFNKIELAAYIGEQYIKLVKVCVYVIPATQNKLKMFSGIQYGCT